MHEYELHPSEAEISTGEVASVNLRSKTRPPISRACLNRRPAGHARGSHFAGRLA
jgi:hypothetical protein